MLEKYDLIFEEQKSKSGKKRICSECGSDDLIRDFDLAEIVCVNCGYVVDEKIMNTSPEWRAYDNEQGVKRTRVGAPMTFTLHDKGLSTTIGWSDKKFIGRKLTSNQKMELYSIRKWQKRVRVSDINDRNLSIALSELGNLSSTLNLPRNIIETASVIYRGARKKRLIRKRSKKSIISASLYLACRQCKVSKTLDEIALVSGLDKKDIARSYRLIISELDVFVPLQTSRNHISRISNKLGLNGRVEIIALKMLEAAKKTKLTTGRNPIGIAAATIYLSSALTNDRRTQRDISLIANTTEVTIRNRCKELSNRLLIEIDL